MNIKQLLDVVIIRQVEGKVNSLSETFIYCLQ